MILAVEFKKYIKTKQLYPEKKKIWNLKMNR